jgi:hypothetical protein
MPRRVLVLVVAATVSLGACGTPEMERSAVATTEAAFEQVACVLHEAAPPAAAQYYSAVLSQGRNCRAIDRVLPRCRDAWDADAEKAAVEALGISEIRLRENIRVDAFDDDASSIRLIGAPSGQSIRSSWVLDDETGRWMIDTCDAADGVSS